MNNVSAVGPLNTFFEMQVIPYNILQKACLCVKRCKDYHLKQGLCLCKETPLGLCSHFMVCFLIQNKDQHIMHDCFQSANTSKI